MSMFYSKDHEWVRVDGDVATVGISDHAQEQLGDVVFVELPEAGRSVKQGEQAAVVESVKAASDVYAPVSGDVVEKNSALEDSPGMVNEAAESEAWFFRVRLSDRQELDGLMDTAAYQAFLETLG
jgi:glycine cleavage system H protein